MHRAWGIVGLLGFVTGCEVSAQSAASGSEGGGGAAMTSSSTSGTGIPFDTCAPSPPGCPNAPLAACDPVEEPEHALYVDVTSPELGATECSPRSPPCRCLRRTCEASSGRTHLPTIPSARRAPAPSGSSASMARASLAWSRVRPRGGQSSRPLPRRTRSSTRRSSRPAAFGSSGRVVAWAASSARTRTRSRGPRKNESPLHRFAQSRWSARRPVSSSETRGPSWTSHATRWPLATPATKTGCASGEVFGPHWTEEGGSGSCAAQLPKGGYYRAATSYEAGTTWGLRFADAQRVYEKMTGYTD